MSNKAFDRLRFAATIIAPIVTFITLVVGIWNVPYADQIGKTLAGLTVLLNTLVESLRNAYHGGEE